MGMSVGKVESTMKSVRTACTLEGGDDGDDGEQSFESHAGVRAW